MASLAKQIISFLCLACLGYAFVVMESSRDAEYAIDKLDGYRLDGRTLQVEAAKNGGGSSFGMTLPLASCRETCIMALNVVWCGTNCPLWLLHAIPEKSHPSVWVRRPLMIPMCPSRCPSRVSLENCPNDFRGVGGFGFARYHTGLGG